MVFSTNTVIVIIVNPPLRHWHQPEQFIGECYLNDSQWKPGCYAVFWLRKVKLKFWSQSWVRWSSLHPHIPCFRINFDVMYSAINLPVLQENNHLQLQSCRDPNDTHSIKSKNFFISRKTTNFSSMTLSVSLQNEACKSNSYSAGTNLALIHKGRNKWQQPWP
jgi:hypothetical protein